MYRVALNTAISFARTTRARERHLVVLDESAELPALEPSRAPQQDERLEQLYGFLHRLAAFDRALVLLYLEDCSYREIADVLGISETNVGTKLGRLKQRMRRELAADRETGDGVR
jgi:RNA polymerase sigma factor (sigma-70 family)